MFLGIGSPAWAQVGWDASLYSTPGITNTCALTLTIGSNANRALIVGVHTALRAVSSVSGAGATWAPSAAIFKASASNRVEIWVGTNPSPGSQTVTVTFPGTDTDIICGVESFYGVNQTSPTAHPIGNMGTGGTAQANVTSAANNMTFALISHDGYFDPPNGCTTQMDWFSGPNQQFGQGTHCAGAGTTTFTWTTFSNWSLAAIDIQAVGAGGSGPPWSGILASSRAIDWSATNAGVEGGIPSRTLQCGTTIPAYTGTAQTINAAIQNCTPGQFVLLGSGTFTLSDGIKFVAKDNVTLRGAGPDLTFLRFTGGYGCGGLGGDLCFLNEEPPNWSGGPGNVANWTSGYSPGTTSITLGANVIGSTKPAVGTLLILDQLDDDQAADADHQQQLWICQKVDVCSQAGGVGQGRSRRGQTQVVRVTSISPGGPDACPCTVTISPGLYMPNWNWRSGKNPQAWWSNHKPIEGSGVEDLSMDHTASNTVDAGTFIYNGRGIWLKNIRSINAKQKHVWMYQSVHTTVRDSYFYGTQNAASESYGTDTFTGGDHLIENNIFDHIASPMVNEGGQGTVHAYNYSVDDYYTAGGTAPQWQQASSYQHAIGNAFLLWEGNDGIALTADDLHGVSDFITGFRNYWNGRDPLGGSDPQLGGKTQQTNAIQLEAYSRYYNVIGNILGTVGYHSNYEWATSDPGGAGDAGENNLSIYSLGYSATEGTKYPSIANDLLVKRTLFRWGNYDVVSGAPRWEPAEVPSGTECNSPPAGIVYCNQVPGSQTLPNSFYLSAKPSWFGAVAWPPIGPAVTGGNVTGVGGHVYKIPARLCWESLALDYAPDPNHPEFKVRRFNANFAACYPSP